MVYDELLKKIQQAKEQIQDIIIDDAIYYDDLREIIHFTIDGDFAARALKEVFDFEYASAFEMLIGNEWSGVIILSSDLWNLREGLIKNHYK